MQTRINADEFREDPNRVVYTAVEDSREAGRSLGEQISAELGDQSPDAVILFVSPKYLRHLGRDLTMRQHYRALNASSITLEKDRLDY